MTDRHDDEFLQEAFEDLRSDTQRRGSVPDATAMLNRARSEASASSPGQAATSPGGPPSPNWARRAGWLSLTAAAAVFALLLVDGPSQADREFERLVASYSSDTAAGAWRSPTGALLDTPGLDLGAVPSFGPSLRDLQTRPRDPRRTDPGRDS